MANTYDPSTDVGKVRLAIGDTDFDSGEGVKPDGGNFSDEELSVFIEAAGTWQIAVASVLRVLANMYSKTATITWVEAYKEDLTKRAEQYRADANDWESKSAGALDDISDAFGYNEDSITLFGTHQWGADPTDQSS